MRACKLAVAVFSFLYIPQTFAHLLTTVTSADPESFVSASNCWSSSNSAQDVVLYTVPTGKTFVMTDVITVSVLGGALRDDGNYIFRYDASNSYQLVSGIKFAQDSVVDVDADGDVSDGGCITISGYLY